MCELWQLREHLHMLIGIGSRERSFERCDVGEVGSETREGDERNVKGLIAAT